MAPISVEQWVDQRQMAGRYTFLRREAVAETGRSAEAVRKALQRMTRRGRLAKVKDYFYVIVPLEYASVGVPPASWFVDDLAAAMGISYYVGVLSAAAQYGASHHAPQEFQVVTDRYLRPISVRHLRLRFLTSKFVPRAAVNEINTPTGTMRVSTPETTAVDLVRFCKAAGGLDHVATVIAELSTSLDPEELLAAARLVGDVPNTRRLGYILEQVGVPEAAEKLHEWVRGQVSRSVALRTGCSHRGGVEDHRWQVLVDRPLEIET